MNRAVNYAETQLRNGVAPKRIIEELQDEDYDDPQAIVAQAKKRRRTKKLIYTLLVAIGVTFIGYAAFASMQPAQAPTPATNTTVDAEAVMIQAVAQNDKGLCDRLDERRQECLAEVSSPTYQPQTRAQKLHAQAQATGNRSLCEDITNSSMRETCLADMQ